MENKFKIGNRNIGKNFPPVVIAEIGINHNGSLDLAKKLINLAADAGFDAVKFQKRDPDISTPEDQKSRMRETPWGEMSYLDYKKKIEFGDKEFNEINKLCKKKKNNLVCFTLGFAKCKIPKKI